MNMRYATTTSLVLLLAGYTVGAGAVEPSAVLRQPQGRVFVGQATAMQPARAGMPLYVGDRVVAVTGGRAEVVYPDGCTVALRENTLLVVKGAGQCKSGGAAGMHGIEGFRSKAVGQAPPSGATAATGADPGNAFAARTFRPTKTFIDSQGNVLSATNNMGLGSGDVVDTKSDGRTWVYFNGCEVKVGPNEDLSVDEVRTRCKGGVWDNSNTGRTDLTFLESSQTRTAGLKYPNGSVLVMRGTAKVPAAPNMPVFGDNRIKTGPDGEVIVVFGGCGVEVEEDKRVTLDELKNLCLVPYWTAGGVAAVAVAVAAGIHPDRPASPDR